ncbi:MAG: ABC transporter permease [Chitinophagales bacterium]|nr:ABC transporter permease [Chitinophagales bacterium]MDW8273504.1 ABC transporter permease [Chitinophagales bacterium]
MQKPVKIITPEPPTLREYWFELKKYRSLIWVFAWQEVKVQYAQTKFGLLWAVFRPLFVLLVFTALFKYLLKVQTQSPYHLFAFAGMIAWNYFQNIVNNCSGAIMQKQHLIKKMYFPKMILPLSKLLVVSVETGISILLMLVFMLVDIEFFSLRIITLPLFVFLNICCGMAVALWMNALNIRFRDLLQIVPTVVGIGIWFTPVFFPTTIIPPQFNFFLYANPMAGVIQGYRFALLGEPFPVWQYWITIALSFIFCLWGAWYLTRVEDKIAEYV